MLAKLAREPKMKLSQMQDLGGCRAIMSSLSGVEQLAALYQPSRSLFADPLSPKVYDYIARPKSDGYRGIHIVARYQSKSEHTIAWQGQRIEIQLRTRLQHAFATAVETVTTFTRAPLKFGGGAQEWRRFFALMGAELADREHTPMVPGTPATYGARHAELMELAAQLRVEERLSGWSHAMKTFPRRNVRRFAVLLLTLDVDSSQINVRGFVDRIAAEDALKAVERKPHIDAVLVGVSSLEQLRAAYPNYYADTKEFMAALNLVIG